MKLTLRLPVFLLGLCAAAALQADPSAQPAKSAAPQFSEKQILEEYGWYIGKQSGLAEFSFTPDQVKVILNGLQGSIGGAKAPYDIEQIGPALNAYMRTKEQEFNAKQQAHENDLKSKNLADGTAYLAKLKDDKNVVFLPSGLAYEIVQPGTGDYPKANQIVKVLYTGKRIDGTVFDSTDRHNPPGPIEFGLDGVIAGWTEGLQKINKGGKIRLYVPANLAYGDHGQGEIQPGDTLVFDVELLDFHDAPAQTPPPTDNPQK